MLPSEKYLSGLNIAVLDMTELPNSEPFPIWRKGQSLSKRTPDMHTLSSLAPLPDNLEQHLGMRTPPHAP